MTWAVGEMVNLLFELAGAEGPIPESQIETLKDIEYYFGLPAVVAILGKEVAARGLDALARIFGKPQFIPSRVAVPAAPATGPPAACTGAADDAAATIVGTSIRTAPRNLAEKLALEEAKREAGYRIMEGKIMDPRYPENVWAKAPSTYPSFRRSW